MASDTDRPLQAVEDGRQLLLGQLRDAFTRKAAAADGAAVVRQGRSVGGTGGWIVTLRDRRCWASSVSPTIALRTAE